MYSVTLKVRSRILSYTNCIQTYWIRLERGPSVSSSFAPGRWVPASQSVWTGSVSAGWSSPPRCQDPPWPRWSSDPPSCSAAAPTACSSSWAAGGPRSVRRWRRAPRRWSYGEHRSGTTGALWVLWCPRSPPLWWRPGTVTHKALISVLSHWF